MKVTVVTLDFGVVGVYKNRDIAKREISDYIDEGISRSIKDLENDYGFQFIDQELIG